MNLNELKAEIVRKGYTINSLAEACGISKNTLYSRISGRSGFKQKEIASICEQLNLDRDSIMSIFFADKVS